MPTTYTVKSLTEAEYQAMREAAAKAGKSMNKWLLEIIRANIQPTEDTAMTSPRQNTQEALDARLSEYICRALNVDHAIYAPEKSGNIWGWDIFNSNGYSQSKTIQKIKKLESKLPTYLRRLCREHGEEAAAASAADIHSYLGRIWEQFGEGIIPADVLTAAREQEAEWQKEIDEQDARDFLLQQQRSIEQEADNA